MFIIKGRQESVKVRFCSSICSETGPVHNIYPPSRRGHGFHAGKLRVSQLKLPLKNFQVDLPRAREDFSHLNVLLDPLVTSLPVAVCSHVCSCVDALVGGWLTKTSAMYHGQTVSTMTGPNDGFRTQVIVVVISLRAVSFYSRTCWTKSSPAFLQTLAGVIS